MTYKTIRLDGFDTMYGLQGKSPAYQTVVSQDESGNMGREGLRDNSLGKWTLTFPPKIASEFEDFVTFFHICNGREHSFGFKDPLDYICTTSQSRIVQLTSTTWQMYKRRSSGSYNNDQPIILPRSGLTTVTGPATYTVSYTTGVITKTGGSGAPTTFSTEFDKLVIFGVDELEYTIVSRGNELLVQWAGVPLEQIPLSAA